MSPNSEQQFNQQSEEEEFLAQSESGSERLASPEDEGIAREQPLERLQATPEDEALHERMGMVDYLLEHAPMVGPGAEFASRVMQAIRRTTGEVVLNNTGVIGMVLGLGMATLVSVFLLIAVLLIVGGILLNWTETYQTLVMVLGEGIAAGMMMADWLNNTISEKPLVPGMTLLSIPLFFIWLTLLRRLAPGDEQA